MRKIAVNIQKNDITEIKIYNLLKIYRSYFT